MILNSVLLAFVFQGKIARVEASQLVERSNACVIVKPGNGDLRAVVTRLVWGSGLKPGDRIRLKGYVFRDFTGFPNEEKKSDYMSYAVDRPSLVFLQPPPKGVSLSSAERFAEWPMIAFSALHHDCYRDLNGRLVVGGVLFSPSMKPLHRDSVSLYEVITAIRRIRVGWSG